ncbi:MAG: hypothetical protein HOQ24_05195 [Mycobacteriaceae bacterium]|nr:hypothetical protein [Mycobacteriaceae bacterium]
MKRSIAAVLIVGGALSTATLTTPAAFAVPGGAESVTCSEYSGLKIGARRLMIDDLLKARPSHSMVSLPATLTSKVDSQCRDTGAPTSTRIARIVDSLDTRGTAPDRSSPVSYSGSTSCATFVRMPRSQQSDLMKRLVRPGSHFDTRFNTAAALVEGECRKSTGSTVGVALAAVERKYAR